MKSIYLYSILCSHLFWGCGEMLSDLSAEATAHSLRTGIFTPSDSQSGLSLASGTCLSIEGFVKLFKLDRNDVIQKGGHVTCTDRGSSIIFINRPGMAPIPRFEVDRKNRLFHYMHRAFQQENRLRFSNIFIRVPFGSKNNTPSVNNQFFVWVIHERGHKNAVLVPLKRHIQIAQSNILFKYHNTVIDAHTGLPSMEYQKIAVDAYSVKSVFQTSEICNGSLVWKKSSGIFLSSNGPKSRTLKWRVQDQDSMEVIGVSEEKVPARLARFNRGCREEVPALVGLKSSTFDPRIIRIFNSSPLQSRGHHALPIKQAAQRNVFALTTPASDSLSEATPPEPNLAVPFENGTHYAPGDRVQLQNGEVAQVLRTVENDGWVSDYYTYDMRSDVSTDLNGGYGEVGYTVDSKGHVTDTVPIAKKFLEIRTDMGNMEDYRVKNLQTVSEWQQSNDQQLQAAERVYKTFDTRAEQIAYAGTYMLMDNAVTKFGKNVGAAGVPMRQQLRDGSIVAATSAGSTLITDFVSTDNTLSERAANGGQAMASAGAIQGLKTVHPFLGGFAKGYNEQALAEARGLPTPDFFSPQSAAWSGSSGGVEVIRRGATDYLDKSTPLGAKTNRFIGYSGHQIISNVAIGNNYASAHLGSVLEGSVTYLPIKGPHKFAAAMAARGASVSGQFGESMIRSNFSNDAMDDGLRNLRNISDTEKAILYFQTNPKPR